MSKSVTHADAWKCHPRAARALLAAQYRELDIEPGTPLDADYVLGACGHAVPLAMWTWGIETCEGCNYREWWEES